jgi:tryptophan-rich sensory protein
MRNKGWALLAFVVVCLAVGFGGSYSTAESIPTWYAQLNKPAWNPPNWLFGPVWTVLYIMMGVAAWLVWREHGFPGASTALTLFGVQLLLNFAWTPLFFGLHWMGIAFAEIILLWLAILATILAFRKLNVVAAWLMVPYLLWVSFAAALNFTLWQMNA